MTDPVLTRLDRIRLLLESSQDYLPPVQIARYGQQAPPHSDPMIHSAVSVRNDAQSAADATRANYREIKRLEAAAADRSGDAWDMLAARKASLWQQGDYLALNLAMVELGHVDAYAHRVLQRTYLDQLRVASWPIIESCIEALGRFMPSEVRIPAWLSDRAGETLHVRIRRLHAEHPQKSQRWLAKRCECDQATVSRALAATRKQVA